MNPNSRYRLYEYCAPSVDVSGCGAMTLEYMRNGVWMRGRRESEDTYFVRDVDTGECYSLLWNIEGILVLLPIPEPKDKEGT